MFDDEGIKLLLPYMKKEKKVERLAIMTVLTDLGSGLSAAVKKEWTKLGGAIVAEETHQQNEINFRPSLLKMLASKPDAIYVTNSSGKESAQFVKQARDLGYKGYFLSYGAYEDPEILAIADKAEGSFFTVPAFDPNSSDPVTRAFVEGFKKKTGKAPNVHQANHYDLVQLVARGVEDLDKAGKPITGGNFKDVLRAKVPTFHGAAGVYKFDYSDGSVIRPTLLKTVKDGKFVVVTQLGS
jgi:ABC-type branched-subunit amino acid transport system substrate-binding protein